MGTKALELSLQQPSRKRTWHPKSRSGCETCKARRVKCDESRPECKRCVSFGRRCGGYAANPEPWLFVSNSESPSTKLNDKFHPQSASYNHGPQTSISDVPYTTQEDHAALGFWITISSPDSSDPPYNALHSVFNTHLPQVAWHSTAVRHGLVAAGSMAMSLAPASGSESERKAAATHAHTQIQLAIRQVLQQTELTMPLVIASLAISFFYGWSGRWNDYKRNIKSSMSIANNLVTRDSRHDVLNVIESMAACADLVPDIAGSTRPGRLCFTRSVLRSVEKWLLVSFDRLGRQQGNDAIISALRCHQWRIWSSDAMWTGLRSTAALQDLNVEETPYRSAYLMLERLWTVPEEFSLSQLTLHLSAALRTTLLYAAQGDEHMISEAAYACHSPPAFTMTAAEIAA